MDISLPKQLQLSLANLLDEHGLAGWTIHGSQNMTTVIFLIQDG